MTDRHAWIRVVAADRMTILRNSESYSAVPGFKLSGSHTEVPSLSSIPPLTHVLLLLLSIVLRRLAASHHASHVAVLFLDMGMRIWVFKSAAYDATRSSHNWY